MEDEADSSSSGVKRVRWDESVVDRAGKNEIVEINNAAGLDQKADTPEVLPVAPSCSANKVIRLMSGELRKRGGGAIPMYCYEYAVLFGYPVPLLGLNRALRVSKVCLTSN